MSVDQPQLNSYFRTLVLLGRASNLPTVWSNCLAAWLLGGGGSIGKLVLVTLGGSFLYVGGMFLNDVFDAAFDRQHRAERPIPSGAISLSEVGWWALGWLAGGTLILTFLGPSTATLGVLLLVSIVVYDAVHKMVAFSPILMALCRLLLYLTAASTSKNGVAGLAIWSGLALAVYVLGISHLARHESTRAAAPRWPCTLLGAPILLALLVNNGEYRGQGLLLSAILLGWILWNLRGLLWQPVPNVGRSVPGLLAGIVLVDWLALGGGGAGPTLMLLVLFSATLVLQRQVPAT